MTTAVATKEANPVAAFSSFLERFKPQLKLALPKHMTADRMARLTLTAFSTTPALQECEPTSIALSMLTAGQLGLEPGVNGACFIVPYNTKDKRTGQWVKKAQLIPGWKGLVDLVSRSGRAAVWTGAVFEGDFFEYALGDRPFITHKPGLEDDPDKLLYVYAVGRVNGSDHPVIEVWSMQKVWRHRDRLNKQGEKHYSYRDPEMYARKVPLLQVLKYMPSSTEVANAVAVADAAERGAHATIDGDFVTVAENDDDPGSPETAGASSTATPAATVQRKSAAVDQIDPASGEISRVEAAAMPAPAGNVKWLAAKIKSLDLSDETVQAMLTRAGGTTMAALTAGQWDTMKAEILAAE